MIFELCCVALLCIIALLLCNILERGKELCEYGLRISYGLTQIARQQTDGVNAFNSLSERLSASPDKFDGEDGENPAEKDPDSPDSMSEADKLAERKFSDGVLNILGYCGMPNEEAKH